MNTIFPQVVQFFASNPWVTALATIISIVSLPLSIFLYIKSLKKKNPSYLIRTFSLISGLKDKISDIQIIYADEDEEIETLSISRVIFVNL